MEKNSDTSLYRRIDRSIMKVVKAISMLGMLSLLIIAVISTINVIASKIFSHPISNVTELVTYLNIPVVFFCVGYVQLDRGHTHIDLIYRHFPIIMHTVIHVIGDLIGVAVCGFAGWRGIVLAMEKYSTSTYATGPSSFLIWPFVLCIGIGYLILALSFLWCIVREFHGESPYDSNMENPSDNSEEVSA